MIESTTVVLLNNPQQKYIKRFGKAIITMNETTTTREVLVSQKMSEKVQTETFKHSPRQKKSRTKQLRK